MGRALMVKKGLSSHTVGAFLVIGSTTSHQHLTHGSVAFTWPATNFHYPVDNQLTTENNI